MRDPEDAEDVKTGGVECPICSAEARPIGKHFPFCSERCRMVDLGRWLTGGYAIPGEPVPPPQEREP